MKHITRFVFAALMLLFALPAWAYDFEVDGIYYQITNSTAPFEVGVTNNNGNPNSYSGHVVIPNQVYHNGNIYTVTSILFNGSSNGAFWNCTESLSVELPTSIKRIGIGAFRGCTGLTSISIPQSVEHIDVGAFAGCSALKTVNYNAINCVMATWSPHVFTGCSSVSTLNIGEGVEVIPEGAFRGMTGLSSVIIPNSVTSIGKSAFSGCITGTASIIIPNSVSSIGESAFSGCTGITSISLPNSITTVEKSTFYGCTGLTSITIPNSVTSVGRSAFYDCNSLTNTDNSNSITDIGIEAFCGCSSLTNINLPNSLTNIGPGAFSHCSSLVSIEIPNSLTVMEDNVFAGCSSLASIEIPNSITSIQRDAFYGCSSLTSITIPISVEYIYPNAFRGCSSLISIIVDDGNPVFDSRNNCKAIIETETNTLMCGCKNTMIPNSVTDIGEDAFYGCSGLTSITIPHTVTTIWGNPFAYCPNLVSITVESGNPYYDSRNNCNAIIATTSHILRCGCKNTNIPNSVTDIGYGAFMGCFGLTSIIIPNSVMSIGNRAFYECTSLSSTTIPNSVTDIGSGAFKECTNLSSITIPNSVVSIGSVAFENTALFNNDNNWESGVLYINDCCIKAKQDVIDREHNINDGTRLIADGAFSGCTGLASISIPNSVISIGNNAFYNCRGLVSINIPNSVISIGDFAFSFCRSLLSIIIPNSVISIGNSAFSDCTNLTEVYVKSITPPACGVKPFPDFDIPISVPCGSKEAYSNAEVWKDYTNINAEFQLSFSARSSDETLGNVRIVHQPDCENNIATVVAEPIGDHPFMGWMANGQVVSTANPYTFAVEDDIELVANFYGTGVDEDATQKITISPNPAKDMVNIECENMKGIMLCAMEGRIIRTYKLSADTFILDMTGLPKGLYILRIETQDGAMINKKIIKE